MLSHKPSTEILKRSAYQTDKKLKEGRRRSICVERNSRKGSANSQESSLKRRKSTMQKRKEKKSQRTSTDSVFADR